MSSPYLSTGKTGPVHRANARSDAILEVRARVRIRRLEAERAGDERGVSRFRAMEAVLATGFIPLACPEAVGIAGGAAAAAASGLTEPEWFVGAVAACGDDVDGRTALGMAVSLLKGAGLWPWSGDAAARPQAAGHDAALGMDLPHGPAAP